MTVQPLQVLLVESSPGAADDACDELAAAKTVVSARVLVALRELDDYHAVVDTVFYD
jgi:hypothetical protein